MKKSLLILLSSLLLTGCALPLPSQNSSTSEESLTTNPSIEDTTSSIEETTSEESIVDSNTSVKQYRVTVICGEGGTYTGSKSGIYDENTELSFVALPDEGYLFDGYYINNKLVATDLKYSFNIDKNLTLEIKFAENVSNDFYYLDYFHVLKASDIPNLAGGTTAEINGLKWVYSSHTYKQDNPKGVQIGSKNNPQTQEFTLKATLPEGVYFTSAFVEVAVASQGNSAFTIKLDSDFYGSGFSSTDIQTFSYELEEVESTSITFGFKANARALYVYSFGFSVKVKSDVKLDLSGDSDIVVDPVTPGKNSIPETNYEPITANEYYNGTNLNTKDSTLVNNLRNLTSDMTKTSYDNAKYMLQYTDENPAKPGYLYGMYDGDDILSEWKSGNTWNREHVWPCAKMALEDEIRPSASTRNHTSDLHNLRAACPSVNGFHSNKYYDEINTATTMYPNVTSEVTGRHNFTGDFRGDVARIMFYMYVRYDGLELSDDIITNNTVNMGKLSLFIEWNELDPVDDFEIQRNDRIYQYQGNRNPFIDYPELVNKIFE